MALREILAVPAVNYKVVKNVSFIAGTCVAFNAIGSTADDKYAVVPADRAFLGTGITAKGNWAGFVADNHAVTGTTLINPDPVGATFISTTNNAVFLGEANGWFVGDKRALADYQDETIINETNLTEGYPANPKRGVGVFVSPGNQFITDQYVATGTATTTTDSGSVTFAVGDPLTFGAGANKGKLVKLTDTTYGIQVARVDYYDSTAGLLWITQS